MDKVFPSAAAALAGQVADGMTLAVGGFGLCGIPEALTADVALVKAWKADKAGNLQFNKTARNFNPLAAMAGRVCVVEVEEIVETGELDPDHIHLSGIYVQRLVLNPAPEKRIEQRTISNAAARSD